jgi:uncharacterized protein (DUF1778 family)
MPRAPRNDQAKSERFHLRTTARQARLIKAGAARRKASLTDYIIDSTCARAEMDLADENHFVLKPAAWNAFVRALDAPPRVPPGLRRLFARKTIVESH